MSLYAKTINDPIHGHIELDELSVAVIDTPQFQRLRDLKQLGAAYYVYPGASHCRFEHSIGVSYLAGEFMEQLRNRQKELEVRSEDTSLVRMAGLCHDLGKPNINWTHEHASQMLLEHLVNDNGIPDLSSDQVRFIQDLIMGEPSKGYDGQHFLFDIVANKRNSIDVDKFDYLSRDCYNVGMKSNYDSSRLMKMARVINDEICFNKNEHYNVYQMFHTRYTLFKSVYTHKTGKAVEYMLVDALLAADPVLNLSDAITDPEAYCTLTDAIIREIERSTDPRLAKSQAILRRLRKRDLYRYVDRTVVDPTMQPRLCKSDVTAERIVQFKPPGSTLKADDIIVEWLELNYGKQDKNPVLDVHFYSKYQPDQSFTIPPSSLLCPRQFSEVQLRLFTRNTDQAPDAQAAFRRYLSDISYQLTPDSSLTLPKNYTNIVVSPLKRRKLQFSP